MLDPLAKGLPQNLDAERCVLSQLLSEPMAMPRATAVLSPDDFSTEAHRRIFRAALDLYESGKPVERLSVAEYLNSQQQLSAVGGLAYLTGLYDPMAAVFGVDHYAGIVREKSILRRTLLSAHKIADLCHSADLSEVANEAEALLRSIGDSESSAAGLKHAREILSDSGGFDGLFAANQMGIPTPFEKLNDLTCGLHPGQMVVLAGRPGRGKSALACQFVEHAVSLNAGASAVFSLEMSSSSILKRMACSSAGVNSNLVRHGRLSTQDRRSLVESTTRILSGELYLSDRMQVTLPAIHNELRRLKSRVRLGLVVVDYLQLMSSSGKAENRTQEVSAASRGMKQMAAEFRVPFLVLSQFNREAVKDGRPGLHHLRESGSIEQDCDVAMLIHEPQQPDPQADGWDVELLLDKQREGPVGMVPLWFDRRTARFDPR